jgi:hypothetical protein
VVPSSSEAACWLEGFEKGVVMLALRRLWRWDEEGVMGCLWVDAVRVRTCGVTRGVNRYGRG